MKNQVSKLAQVSIVQHVGSSGLISSTVTSRVADHSTVKVGNGFEI